MKNKISLIIISALILAIAAAAAAIFLLEPFNDDYAIKIGDNIKVSSGEYMVYLYEQKKHFEETGGTDIWETDIDGVLAEDLAKQNAIDTIVDVKAAIEQAKKFNIQLSDDDRNNAKKEADRFFNEIGEERAKKFNVTYDDIYKIIEEGIIRTKVFDYITGGFTVNDEEFDEYFEAYFEQNKADLVNMKVKYIFKGFNKDKSNFEEVYVQMNEILSKAKSGVDFDSLINQYSERDEKGEVQLKRGLFEASVEEVLCNINEKGTITNIIAASNGFYIVYVADVSPIDISSLKQAEKESYIKRKKDELYRQQSEKWPGNFSVEKKDEVFSAINIKDIN